MRNRLPVYIESRDLPIDQYRVSKQAKHSYGYVNVLYLASIIITLLSVITVIVVGNR